MQTALHQNLIAAQIDRFLDFLQQHFAVEHVAFFVLRRAVERAKSQTADTDVRVVDVAIDVVGAVRLGMQPARHGIGRAAQRRQIVRFEQRQPFVGRQRIAGDRFIQQSGNGRSKFNSRGGKPQPLGLAIEQFQAA